MARRVEEASAIWQQFDRLTLEHRLPDRVTNLLYEAILGYRLRRGTYVKMAGVEERTATRDLAQLCDKGLLQGVGERQGRYYLAGQILVDVPTRCRESRRPVADPYPWLPARLLAAVGSVVETSFAGPG